MSSLIVGIPSVVDSAVSGVASTAAAAAPSGSVATSVGVVSSSVGVTSSMDQSLQGDWIVDTSKFVPDAALNAPFLDTTMLLIE